MKKTVVHSIFSSIVTLILLLPFAIQTLHALENHKHVHCNAVNEKHFHKKEIDCHFYHLTITYNWFNFNSDFTIIESQSFFQLFDYYNQTYFYSFRISKSSRAPPIFS